MTTIFQHWTGKLTATASPLTSSEHAVDLWFPSEKPDGATSIAADTFADNNEVFHKVIALTGKIGPIRITLGEDILFSGMIEYWKG